MSKTTQFQAINKQTIAKSAEGYPLLGYCVYWSMTGFETAYTDLVQNLTDVGIPADVAYEPRAKSALVKALKAATKSKDGQFHRNVRDEKKEAAFAIVQSSVDRANDDVSFQTETKVKFNKEAGTVDIQGAQASEIEGNFQKYRNLYTTDQFRALVKRFLFDHCSAFAIRDNGGVYFVPSTQQENFDRLSALFARYTGCSLDVIPVIDTASAKKSMWKALVGEVEQDLAQFKAAVDAMDDKTRDSTVETRLEEYQTLKNKVEMYEGLLSGTASGLKNQLDDVAATLKRRLV